MPSSTFMSLRQQHNKGNGRANHPATIRIKMEHTDFLQQTISLQQEKVRSLNENMKNRIGREYHWFVDFPYAEMDLDGNGSPIEAKIMAVKYPIGEHNGILIMPDEDKEYYEVGWEDLQPDDITNILDALPDEDD